MSQQDIAKLDKGKSHADFEIVPESARNKFGNLPIPRADLEILTVAKNGETPLPDGLGGSFSIPLSKVPAGSGIHIRGVFDPDSEMGRALIRRLYDTNDEARAIMDKHGYNG